MVTPAFSIPTQLPKKTGIENKKLLPTPLLADYCIADVYHCVNTGGVAYLRILNINANPISFTTVASFPGLTLNSMGYNMKDGNFYAISTHNRHLYKITPTGEITDLNVILPLNTAGADIDTAGYYYTIPPGKNYYYKINLNNPSYPLSSISFSGSFTSNDIAYSPYTNTLYGVNNNVIYKLNLSNNQSTNVISLSLPLLFGGGYGACWTGSDGFFYASNENSGNIYKINVSTNSAQVIGSATQSSSNDGAHCSMAPIEVFPPVANNDAITIQEDNTGTFANITSNDTDADGNVVVSSIDLNTTLAGQQTSATTAQGSWSVNLSTGSVTFLPTANFNGTATLTYTVNDNFSTISNIATLTVTVTAVNDAPVANNDVVSGLEDETVVLTNIAANDTDVDGTVLISTIDLDVLTAGIQTSKTTNHGTYVLNTANGNVTFTPVMNWFGTTNLNYTIADNTGSRSNSGMLTVTLSPVNDAPIITTDIATGNEDAPFINVSQITNNDVDPEAETIVKSTIDIDPSTPGQQTTRTTAAGNWSVNLTDGTVTLIPAANYFGTATIQYTVADINGTFAIPGNIIISINEINDAPFAQANSLSSTVNTMATLPNITLNDSDAENELDITTLDLDPLTNGQQLTLTTIHGVWTANTTNGNVTFMPIRNYVGTTSIQYTISDLDGAVSNAAALTVTVISYNIAPVAVNNNATGLEDANYINIANVQNNDTDADGNIQIVVSSIDLDTLTSGQQINITNNFGNWSVDTTTGTVSYTPKANFVGMALAYYKIKDVFDDWSNVATLSVDVLPVNDAPWAVADSNATNANITLIIPDITLNDTDNETSVDPATVDLDLTQAGIQTSYTNSYGIWSYNTNSHVVYYSPANNFTGLANTYYKIKDTDGAESLPGKISVFVHPKITIAATPNPNQEIFVACGTGTMTNTKNDSWNSSWVDYNRDGWEDLFIANTNSTTNTNQLFKSNGDGTFSEISNINLVSEKLTTMGSIWGDIDNDGDQDVIVINNTYFPTQLYKNNGDETFTLITESGLNTALLYYHGGAFVDYDNDGYLDLIMTNYFETKFSELYHNNGNGTFTMITNTPINMVGKKALGPVWGDFNNDGNQDLFIPNGDGSNNSLFKNNGNGSFTRITSGAIVNDGGNSVGACWGDYDNDGFIDLFVANASNENNFLYHNNGNETFTKITTGKVVNDKGHSHGCNWVDVDNDGDKDLYVTNDLGLKYLYINDGKGNLDRKTNEALAINFGKSFGQAWADFDKDGDMDVFVSTHGNDKNMLFCNRGNTNKWINIKLVGTVSNRDAIGARLQIKCNGEWQTSQVTAQSGFSGQNSLRQHFGLATATIIDSILIHWPSGVIQKMAYQSVNTFITITEPNSASISGVAYDDQNGDCIKNDDEPTLANMLISVSPIGMVASTNGNGEFELNLSPGEYSLDGIDNNYWTNNCNPINQTVVGSSQQYVVNIPFNSSSDGIDLSTTLASTAWRRGFTNITGLQFNNLGTKDASNVVVTIVYPEQVIALKASTPWSTKNGQTYTWNIGTMAAGSSYFVQITDSVTLNAVTGQSLEIISSINAVRNELNVTNNTYSLVNQIVGPLDPNDISVSPIGEGDNGIIDRDQLLTYTVRFQNVGTYPATNVIIKNQLPKYLNKESFQLISASHSYNYSINDKNELEITFKNINLPDSTRDEAGSHGIVKYQIRPLHSVSEGDVIKNAAAIYFDYEEPVITNVVKNTIRYNSKTNSVLEI